MKNREGTFWHREESFVVRRINDGTEFVGMFEVVDSHGFQISCAFTSKLAVQNALDELEYVEYHLNAFLIQMFGECA